MQVDKLLYMKVVCLGHNFVAFSIEIRKGSKCTSLVLSSARVVTFEAEISTFSFTIWIDAYF